MSNEEKTKKEEDKKVPQKRQVIIETDGNSVEIIKADVAGGLELTAILESILNKIKR